MKNLLLSWKTSHKVSEWAWAWRSSSCRLRNVYIISKVHYFDFLVFCLYTFNPLSFSPKWVMTLAAITYKQCRVGSPAKLPTWWEWRGQKGDHLLSFQVWILFCTILIKQIKLPWKLRNRNKKFQTTMSKYLVEFY